MKKVIKHKSELSQQEITYTVNKKLNKLKAEELASPMLEEINELLRKLKMPLPK